MFRKVVCRMLVTALVCLAVPAFAADEAELINTLTGDADWAAKQAACRALRQIGTAASVPALAALLPDPALSGLARYALEPMPAPEAGAALRAALGTVEGALKAGVATSLGVRRDAEAVSLLAPLTGDPDAVISGAAAGALGRIASAEAVDALMSRKAGASGDTLAVLGEALSCAGQEMVKDGKGGDAVKLYESLLGADWPMHVRLGAFRGLAAAQPKEAPKRLMDALEMGEPLFRDLAAQLVAETPGDGATAQYADMLPKLPPEAQAALLRGLAGRKDTAAHPAVVRALEQGELPVKLAAVRALSVLGNASDVPRLTALLGGDNAELAASATACLASMPGDEIDAAMAEAVPAAQPKPRVALLEVLSGRAALQAVSLAVADLKHDDPGVRLAALDVIAQHGGMDQIASCLDTLFAAPEGRERGAAERALGAVCVRLGADALPPVLDRSGDPRPEMRMALLRVAAQVAAPVSLETVLAALNDADTAVAAEALRLLSDWTSFDALPPLRALASGDDASRQVLGLRGFIRLAQTEADLEKRAVLLDEAAGMVRRADEMKLLLAAWGKTPSLRSVDFLLPRLDEAEVAAEAAVAVIALAPELAKINRDSRVRAREALAAVIEKSGSESIRERAGKALEAVN